MGDLQHHFWLYEKYGPKRVKDTAIGEAVFVEPSIMEMRPIAELMFVDFLGVCFDQFSTISFWRASQTSDYPDDRHRRGI